MNVRTLIVLACCLGLASPATADGTKFWDLCQLTTAEGSHPIVGLVASGTVLYGVTMYDGSNSGGTLFKLDLTNYPTTTTYTVLYSFGSGSDGANPSGTPIIYNGNIYGTCQSGGGTDGAGTAWQYTISTPAFTVLHIFKPVNGDGSTPIGGLVHDPRSLHSDTFWGTCHDGGTNGYGIIYSVTTGKAETIAYNLTGSANPYSGSYPMDSLIFPGGGTVVYGTCYSGGVNNTGTAFKYDVSSGTMTKLAELSYPVGSLLLDNNSKLWGTCSGGNGSGYVFRMNTDGTSFLDVHDFGSPAGDGEKPYAGLLWQPAVSKLYGTTACGGTNGNGTVYGISSIGASNPSYVKINDNFTETSSSLGGSPESPLVDGFIVTVGGTQYHFIFGTCYIGGAGQDGLGTGGGVVDPCDSDLDRSAGTIYGIPVYTIAGPGGP